MQQSTRRVDASLTTFNWKFAAASCARVAVKAYWKSVKICWPAFLWITREAYIKKTNLNPYSTKNCKKCDFLLLSHSHQRPISHRFQVTIAYWSNVYSREKGTLLWRPRSGWTMNFGYNKTERSACSYLEPFRRGPGVWRTDRQTDERTEMR